MKLAADDINYPRDLFYALISGNSPYAFYLFQWVPYQTDARLWRLKMKHDVKAFDGREALGIWPNGSSCGPFKDSEVEFIRISKDQGHYEWVDPRPNPPQGRIMSNQPQAHVADERAAFDEAYRSYSSHPDWSHSDAACDFHWAKLAGHIWRTARATIPAGANVASIGKDEQFRTLLDKHFYAVPSVPGGDNKEKRNDLIAYINAWGARIAAGAPAETPKPVCQGMLTECPTCKNDMRKCVRPAAQPAPAPATDARDAALRFADEILSAVLTEGADFDGGHLQQMALEHGLLRVEEMAEPCGENCACANDGVPFWPAMCYRKTYRAAMLSANSPREAG